MLIFHPISFYIQNHWTFFVRLKNNNTGILQTLEVKLDQGSFKANALGGA